MDQMGEELGGGSQVKTFPRLAIAGHDSIPIHWRFNVYPELSLPCMLVMICHNFLKRLQHHRLINRNAMSRLYIWWS